MSDETVSDQNDRVAASPPRRCASSANGAIGFKREKNDLAGHREEVMTEVEGRCYCSVLPHKIDHYHL